MEKEPTTMSTIYQDIPPLPISDPKITAHKFPEYDLVQSQSLSPSSSKSVNNRTEPHSSSSSKTRRNVGEDTGLRGLSPADDGGRKRLKRHRVEMGGRVWIPEIWGKEELLKDWNDCAAFDASLVPTGIMSARTALVEEARRANSSGLRIENRCS